MLSKTDIETFMMEAARLADTVADGATDLDTLTRKTTLMIMATLYLVKKARPGMSYSQHASVVFGAPVRFVAFALDLDESQEKTSH